MDEVKAERLVRAVEKIAACLEVMSKHLEGPNKRKPVKHPQNKEDLFDGMSDEKILKMAKELPDEDLSNPYPDPNK